MWATNRQYSDGKLASRESFKKWRLEKTIHHAKVNSKGPKDFPKISNQRCQMEESYETLMTSPVIMTHHSI